MTCPSAQLNRACTYGPDFGPCDTCHAEDQANLAVYGVPLPDYAEARTERMAEEIQKLQAAVRNLSAAHRRSSK